MKLNNQTLTFEQAREENIKRWGSWLCNVRNKYKPLSEEEIKADLKLNALPYAILLQNIEGDFNLSSIIRSANNFGVSKVFYHGRKRYDKRGALGTYKYTEVEYLSSIEQVKELKRNYVFVGIENNVPDCVPIKSFKYPKNTMLVFGEENGGIDSNVLEMVDHKVEIPSRGSVRSLNVGSAASIVLYDYVSKYEEK